MTGQKVDRQDENDSLEPLKRMWALNAWPTVWARCLDSDKTIKPAEPMFGHHAEIRVAKKCQKSLSETGHRFSIEEISLPGRLTDKIPI